MTIPLLIITNVLLLIIVLCLYVRRGKKVSEPENVAARGTFMTIVYDADLNIVDIVNPQSDILLAKSASSLIGLNARDLETVLSEENREDGRIITDHIVEASETKSDVFFEYSTVNPDSAMTHTVCYVEYRDDGSLLGHAIRMDTEKRVKGCGKCADYVLAIAMNNISVGVYTKRVGEKPEYVFANNVLKRFCESDDVTKSPHWVQQEEDEADRKAVDSKEIVSYDKVVYTKEGRPKQWFNISKVLQSMGPRGDYIITTVTDISEQKRREEELQEAKVYLGMAIGAGDVSVWRYNLKGKQFYSLYGKMDIPDGYTLENLLGAIHPDDREACIGIYENLLTGRSESEEIVFNFTSPNTQASRYIQSVLTVTLSNDGEVENVIGTHKDITESQLKENELRDMGNSLDMAIVAGDILAWEFDIPHMKFRNLYGGDHQENWEVEAPFEPKGVLSHLHPTEIEKYHTFVNDLVDRGAQGKVALRGTDLGDGTHTYYEVMVSTLKDKQGVVEKIIGTRRNISESENRKINLEKTQKYLSLAMEAGGVSVWIYDIAKEMFFTLQGDTIAGDGLSMEDNLTMMHPDDAIVCKELVERMARGEKNTASVVYRFRSDDIEGGYRYYEARKITIKEDGVITYLTGTQKEVTKEYFYRRDLEESNLKAKLALDELKQLNKYNRLILDNTNSGLVYLSPDYVTRWENVSTMKIPRKFAEAYHTGQICYKSARGLNSPCPDCIMQQAIETKQQVGNELVLDTGEIMDILAIPVYDGNGEIDGVVLRIDDVTQMKQSYNELQIAKEKAERSDRFKSTFLANMSHEIRTPLNAIVGFSELLTEVDSEDDKREYSKIIAKNNELLLKLINDILDLSKIEAGFINIRHADFDLAELYDELATTFSQRMPPDVEFICENPLKYCIVNLDRNRLTQIITNFVTNAIKFTQTGFIKIGYEWIGEGLRIYVTDTGIGITPEKKESVFDRFEKLNDFAQGTGLGLSICKSIVEAENGTVGVDSVQGEGSTFWAVLPCKTVESGLNRAMQVNSSGVVGGGEVPGAVSGRRSILIAEDTDSNFILINSMLRNKYDLTRVINGQLAVSAVRDRWYDIVLMDIKMPVMNGFEATRKIREFNTTIPIIALTANVFDSDRKQAVEAGCTGFLAKPIDRTMLMNTLEEV